MYGTSQRKNLEKVRRRLVFDSVEPVQPSTSVSQDDLRGRLNQRMAQAYVDTTATEEVVFFLGYRNPLHTGSIFYCCNCIDEDVGFDISERETDYIVTGEKNLSQFTDKDHQDESNYCYTCQIPLYDLVNEQCRLSRPTSNKWRQRFQKKRQYGLRGGGTSRSTRQ